VGFSTSSYLLFANTTVVPMLGFVYRHDDTTSSRESTFNYATIAGCIVGMIGFGIAADVLGRRRIYGYEIILLMLGTMGVVMSSAGYIPFPQANGQDHGSINYSTFGSMDINSWLLFWRFCSGVGIGGEYPLTAVIASEFAPTRSRPRMLATVFAMQSVGIAMGAIVSLVVTVVMQSVYPYDPAHPEASTPAIDSSWRWVMGLALIPGLVTAIMRFSTPESLRYTLDILDDPVQASEDARRLRGLRSGSEVINNSTTRGPFQRSEHLDEEQVLNASTPRGDIQVNIPSVLKSSNTLDSRQLADTAGHRADVVPGSLCHIFC
jgi:MFS transporter, PHS family, inorganic phosphate transporter